MWVDKPGQAVAEYDPSAARKRRSLVPRSADDVDYYEVLQVRASEGQRRAGSSSCSCWRAAHALGRPWGCRASRLGAQPQLPSAQCLHRSCRWGQPADAGPPAFCAAAAARRQPRADQEAVLPDGAQGGAGWASGCRPWARAGLACAGAGRGMTGRPLAADARRVARAAARQPPGPPLAAAAAGTPSSPANGQLPPAAAPALTRSSTPTRTLTTPRPRSASSSWARRTRWAGGWLAPACQPACPPAAAAELLQQGAAGPAAAAAAGPGAASACGARLMCLPFAAAAQVLGDPELRERYDEHGKDVGGASRCRCRCCSSCCCRRCRWG
jgi:hypothetical protein